MEKGNKSGRAVNLKPFSKLLAVVFLLVRLGPAKAAQISSDLNVQKAAITGTLSEHSEGLHGYIGFGHEKPPPDSKYTAGMVFYAAVWLLMDQPLANFQGPVAYYIPETWSKIGKLFNYPFVYGRGLDARPGNMGGGAMEINTVPRFDSKDAQGVVYSKIPRLRFPVDKEGRAFLV